MRGRKKKKAKARSDTSFKAKKIAKIKASKAKKVVERTRNSGRWTEGEYFGRIRSALRRAFRFWEPMQEALKKASRPSQNLNKRVKVEYQCNHCKGWFIRRNVQIDHIEECGSLMKYEDIVPFLQRLTKEGSEHYQVLCKTCHSHKTKEYLKTRKL